MVGELTQKELTKEQILEYLIQKPNIIKKRFMSLDTLEMVTKKEENSSGLRSYVNLTDTLNNNPKINSKSSTKRLEIHLTYPLNPINERLIEKVFGGNENIKVIYPLVKLHSTRVSREIEKLEDVDDILDLATRYHEIVNSEDYHNALESYWKSMGNLANELSDGLVKI